jgi:spermidine synthase
MDDAPRPSSVKAMALGITSKLHQKTNSIPTQTSALWNLNPFTRGVLFVLFFLSGLSGLVYQVVWVRMAFASFGILIQVLSIVLSVFMLGLSLGAWAGGRSVNFLVRKAGCSALWFYAGTELLIGIGAFAVPALFSIGAKLLLSAGETDSTRYLFLSAMALGISIFPWCVFMGATFPFMMAFVREQDHQNAESFSFLYVANVLGAMAGTLVSAIVLVELLGFRHTLWVAAAGNFSIAIVAGSLAFNRGRLPSRNETGVSMIVQHVLSKDRLDRFALALLFLTGFAALGMEVMWARAFTPILKTQVYSFALVVFAYLGATFVGSFIYRRDLRKNSVRSVAVLLSIVAVAVFVPIVSDDLRIFLSASYAVAWWSRVVLLLSICPFCAALGYLTPKLIDSYALGEPNQAGRAYAVNALGCILGPLFASYLLLPWAGERIGLVILGAPFLLLFILITKSLPKWYRCVTGAIATTLLIWSFFFSVDFAQFVSRNFQNTEIRRDYAASVVSSGSGFEKRLFVNGIGMTSLVPATKFMAHLPLVLHDGKPNSVLIICFGMGTTYRSALSWNVQTTAVELVPSVKKAFGFYYSDAAQVLSNPDGRIIIDDGRRYLNRTREKFDVIIIDPPPPVEAAGSSLLYSEEFYELAKAHLNQDGIVATWVPADASRDSRAAILQSLVNSFSFVRCFVSVDNMGMHMLASQQPIANISAREITSRMPAAAAIDLLEWERSETLIDCIQQVLRNETPVESVLNPHGQFRITDDRPYNEYFLLRRWHDDFVHR